LGVLRDGHAVVVVGCDLVGGCDEGLVEVELADVCGAAGGDGVVGEFLGAEVDDCCMGGLVIGAAGKGGALGFGGGGDKVPWI
jgi:hypothetical protein